MRSEVEEIKARLDIVDLIGQHVQLRKAGRTFKALCPFHSEKLPSFVVSPERQSWHCFGGCGTGGDIISFVMRKEGLEFKEALAMLAERAGVRLQERRRSSQEEQRLGRLKAANEAAAEWHKRRLWSVDGGRVRDYLERRGVDREAADMFTLGYSPPGWQLLRDYLVERGFNDSELVAAGLLVEPDSRGRAGERPYDRFRGRLMFPIRDGRGTIVGFGARTLDNSEPKYLNTPQTPLFDKSGILYGIDRAAEAIRGEGRAVIVEGYMDVIAAHQHGFSNVVGSMGTSLTERQVMSLKRLTGAIVMALDADAAGKQAALRSHDVVRETLRRQDSGEERMGVVSFWGGLVRYQEVASVDLKVAELPDGRDPDDVIRESREVWRSLISEAKPVLDYQLQIMAARNEISGPQGRSKLVAEFMPLLATVTDPVMRTHYLRRLSRLTLVSERDLAQMLPSRGSPGRRQDLTPAANRKSGDKREHFLLALLLRNPELRPEGLEIPEALLWEEENRQVLSIWKEVGGDSVKERLPEELEGHLDRLINRDLPPFSLKEAREALADCRRRLERRRLEAEKQAMTAMLAAQEEEIGVAPLIDEEYMAVGGERKNERFDLYMLDTETGLRLHQTERDEKSG